MTSPVDKLHTTNKLGAHSLTDSPTSIPKAKLQFPSANPVPTFPSPISTSPIQVRAFISPPSPRVTSPVAESPTLNVLRSVITPGPPTSLLPNMKRASVDSSRPSIPSHRDSVSIGSPPLDHLFSEKAQNKHLADISETVYINEE